jgi:hypothetical protein
LLIRGTSDNVHFMYTLARLLQIAGLVILPLAMFAQLSYPEQFKLGPMLQFLVVGVCLFTIGYLLQAYSGRK